MTTPTPPIQSWTKEILELEEDYYSVVIPLFTDQLGDNSIVNPLGVVPATMTDANSFEVPRTHVLAVFKVWGHMAANWADPALDTGTVYGDGAALGNAAGGQSYPKQVRGMMLGRAMSAGVELRHVHSGYRMFDGGADSGQRRYLNLASILFSPIDWSQRPHIVPAGEILEVAVTILDTSHTILSPALAGQTGPLMPGDRAYIKGNSTDSGTFAQWGVVLQGLLIRRAE